MLPGRYACAIQIPNVAVRSLFTGTDRLILLCRRLQQNHRNEFAFACPATFTSYSLVRFSRLSSSPARLFLELVCIRLSTLEERMRPETLGQSALSLACWKPKTPATTIPTPTSTKIHGTTFSTKGLPPDDASRERDRFLVRERGYFSSPDSASFPLLGRGRLPRLDLDIQMNLFLVGYNITEREGQ